jgi:ferritin-like metal-binding protein YciE
MASEKTLQELFHETLKDIYFAEKKIFRGKEDPERPAEDGEGRSIGRSQRCFRKA